MDWTDAIAQQSDKAFTSENSGEEMEQSALMTEGNSEKEGKHWLCANENAKHSNAEHRKFRFDFIVMRLD